MSGKTFRGGVHPLRQIHEGKPPTRGAAVRPGPEPDILVYPMSCFIGAPAKPCVKKGERVLVGQAVGQPQGKVSVPVFSAVSGKVMAVENRPSSNGKTGLAVVVENDRQYETVKAQPYGTVDELSPEQILEAIGQAGIVGMGGATFPTHVKLMPPPGKQADLVILNGSECEPFLSADHRLMVERPQDVLMGLWAVMKVLGADKGIIGVENNKPDAIEALQLALSQMPVVGASVQPLKVKYPQGAEKQLILTASGRVVPAGGLPVDAGVVVVNVSTAAAIAKVLETGLPPVERIVTVTGAVVQPSNLLVRFGTPFAACIEHCQGFAQTPKKVLSGGPMMGIAQYTLDVPVMAGTSGILVLDEKLARTDEAGPCLRCGRCVSACPMRLLPLDICNAAEANDLDTAARFQAASCIECGSCAYICPARRHLLQSIRLVKGALAQRARAAAKK